MPAHDPKRLSKIAGVMGDISPSNNILGELKWLTENP